MAESEMVERVARVLCKRSGVNPDDPSVCNHKGLAWTIWAKDARAALEAIRDPEVTMKLAGGKIILNQRNTVLVAKTEIAGDVWQAMIDEALKQ